MQPEKPSEYISTAKIAALVGVVPDTVLNWVRNGKDGFPAPALRGRVGKSYRWKRSAIEEWLAEQEASADVA